MRYIMYPIIAVVVSAIIGAAGKIASKKHQEVMNDPTVSPMNFVITNKNGLYTVIYVIGLLFAIGLGIGLFSQSGFSAWLVIPAGFILLVAYGLMELYIWKIQVIGNEVIYTNTFGKVTRYNISDITRVTGKYIPNAGAYRLKVYAGDKKIFSIAETTDDVYLLKRLEELGVPCEEV